MAGDVVAVPAGGTPGGIDDHRLQGRRHRAGKPDTQRAFLAHRRAPGDARNRPGAYRNDAARAVGREDIRLLQYRRVAHIRP